jgi:hypothetical protein
MMLEAFRPTKPLKKLPHLHIISDQLSRFIGEIVSLEMIITVSMCLLAPLQDLR